ncbi:MAG: hypothetical protein AB7U83_20590 [Vicinamibacterales bacterium]
MRRACRFAPIPWLSLLLVAVTAVRAAGQMPAAAEADPVLRAADLLSAAELRGPHHAVEERVETPGPYHVFTLQSTFGRFEAEGRGALTRRLEDIAAMAALEELNKAGVFARAAGTSLVKVGTGVVDAVSDPVATAKGVGAGVKRLAVNLGRRGKRVVQRATDDRGGSGDAESSTAAKAGGAAGSAAKSLLGVTRARREWARRVGADPYTTNPTLKAALEEVAAIDAAGGIATRLVVPIPPLVSTTADVGDLVWGRDPEELRKLNEARAREAGVSDAGFAAFFGNFTYTLTMQTRLVAALHAVGVPGAGDYLETAAEADDEREAWSFVESAELLQRFHAASPVAALLTDSRAIVARMPAGQAVALLPFDWLRRSESVVAEFRQLGDRTRAELGARTLHVRVSGRITDAAAAALADIGWQTR